MKEITITAKDAGQRLDKYLRKYMPAAGSGFLYKMLRKKNITWNGKKAEGNELLQSGDVIRIFFSDETFAKMCGETGTAEGQDTGDKKNASVQMTGKSNRQQKALEAFQKWKQIEIVYEDEDLLFVNKPSGMLCQGDERDGLSLNDWILGYCMQNQETTKDLMQVSVCNRLDRNTSGLVLCGKTYAGSRFLSDQIKAHGFRKLYRALVEGEVFGVGALRGYWSKDATKNIVRITSKPVNRQDPVVETNYRALRYLAEEKKTLLEVELITGKSHQIRAHMASIGHPLAGDLKYGGHPFRGSRTQYLHAYAVRFPVVEGMFARLSGKCFSCEVDWLKEM
ncbi:MAG: RluA family pseudouridine synthase [Lachnospiraceae bacterium]|nr:RluA family pseudouridine synthase [Lachnospiraceae bacterium]